MPPAKGGKAGSMVICEEVKPLEKKEKKLRRCRSMVSSPRGSTESPSKYSLRDRSRLAEQMTMKKEKMELEITPTSRKRQFPCEDTPPMVKDAKKGADVLPHASIKLPACRSLLGNLRRKGVLQPKIAKRKITRDPDALNNNIPAKVKRRTPGRWRNDYVSSKKLLVIGGQPMWCSSNKKGKGGSEDNAEEPVEEEPGEEEEEFAAPPEYVLPIGPLTWKEQLKRDVVLSFGAHALGIAEELVDNEHVLRALYRFKQPETKTPGMAPLKTYSKTVDPSYNLLRPSPIVTVYTTPEQLAYFLRDPKVNHFCQSNRHLSPDPNSFRSTIRFCKIFFDLRDNVREYVTGRMLQHYGLCD